MARLYLVLLTVAASLTNSTQVLAAPNILILIADDWSWPHASGLGDVVVQTPTFDRLVDEGVLFERAFVASPSCTPSRSAIVTGQWTWRLGEAVHLGGSLPRNVPTYPELLAEAGFHIGFMAKGVAPSPQTNREGRDPLGEKFESFDAFLAERDADQPFCFWFGSGDPHRPYDLNRGEESGLDPNAVDVPPYLPDNAVTRGDICDYYWEVQRFDDRAGRILRRVEELGELNNTLIVMTGDNGWPFPRAKATLYDAGTRVPLVVRWGDRGSPERIPDFITLCDLAPTVLEAAGLAIPEEVTGHSLLPLLDAEPNAAAKLIRDHVLLARERHVTRYPMRAIRTADFLYIRNFEPESWDPLVGIWESRDRDFSYAIDPGPIKHWLLEHAAEPDVLPFYHPAFNPPPAEQLFVLGDDPHQLHDVAGDSEYGEVLESLRTRLARSVRESGDFRFGGLD